MHVPLTQVNTSAWDQKRLQLSREIRAMNIIKL